MRIKINVFLYKFFWLVWILGLHYFYLYFFFFKNLKHIFFKRISDVYFFVLILFFFFQLLSTFCSVNSDYFSYDRFAAIVHNEIVYLFIILGYVVYDVEEVSKLIRKNTLFLLTCIALIIVITGFFSYYFKQDFFFDNIMSKAIGSFPKTVFTKTGWYEGERQVRNLAFTLYPNSTGILLMLLYALAYESLLQTKFVYRLIISSVVLVSIVFTGSRIVSLFALLNVLLLFFNNPKSFKLSLIILTLILIPVSQTFLSELDEIYSARGSSNDARYFIQSFSLNFMYDRAPIIGIGLKPRLNELLGGEYPIGSHSTYIGYFVKNGIIGGGFIAIFFLSLFVKSLFTILKEKFSYIKIVVNLLFIEILIILFFEDIDAYELNALLFGFLIAYVKNMVNAEAVKKEE